MRMIDWASLDEADWLETAEMQIWLSAFANNNPHAPAHAQVGRAYDDAQARGKPWLYQKAWNAAYSSCGYTPSDEQLQAAEPK